MNHSAVMSLAVGKTEVRIMNILPPKKIFGTGKNSAKVFGTKTGEARFHIETEPCSTKKKQGRLKQKNNIMVLEGQSIIVDDSPEEGLIITIVKILEFEVYATLQWSKSPRECRDITFCIHGKKIHVPDLFGIGTEKEQKVS